MMHGKWGDTVNRGTVNRGTVNPGTISVCGVDKLVVHASIGLEYNMKKRNLKMRTEGFILTCHPNAAPQVILT